MFPQATVQSPRSLNAIDRILKHLETIIEVDIEHQAVIKPLRPIIFNSLVDVIKTITPFRLGDYFGKVM